MPPALRAWYMVWPRTPAGSALSTMTLRDRLATSLRNSPVAEVFVRQRLVELDGGAVDLGNAADLAAGFVGVLAKLPVAALALGPGDEEFVADAPAGRRGLGDQRGRRPGLAVLSSSSQVRFIGAPWTSMRPPQQTMAGPSFLSMPSR